MRRPIRCKLVKILSSQELIVDAGSDHGVEEDMVFKIIGFLPVTDPDGELIETLEIVKARVKTIIIGKKVAVAQTYLNVDAEFKRALSTSAFVPQVEKMTTQQTTQSDEWGKVVKVGDDAILDLETD